jgi:HK97 gp10 family phage protein
MVRRGVSMKVDSHVNEVLAALRSQTERAMEECAMVAESDTKRRCPVDTGNLRSSYTHTSNESQMIVGTDVDYGKYQELGTSRNRPQPHLRPSFSNNIERFKAIIISALRT